MPNMSPLMEGLKIPAARAAGGAVFGGVLGGYANPYAFGYEDNPRLRIASAILNASIYGGIAGLGPGAWKAMYQKNPSSVLAIPGGILAGELAPVGINLGNKATEAATALAQKPPTASEQARAILYTPQARGAAAGAAMAGLGGIVTGLLRPRRESEKYNTSRVSMVKKDLLTYLIPAMLAGGLIGHMSSRPGGS